MSEPILPLAVWQSGTNENSIPANDNALRLEALSRLVISKLVSAQPVSPEDGDVYIIPSGATGAQWEDFDQYDITIYRSGTWYAWAPVDGIVVNVNGGLQEFSGSSGWTSIGGGGGSGIVESVVAGTGISVDDTDPANPIVSATGGGGGTSVVEVISGTTYTVIADDDGAYLRFTNGSAKSVTVDPESTTPLPDNGEWYFRNHGANDLTFIEGSGVMINPPVDGSLVVPSGGTVVLKRVAADVFDLAGSTNA